MELKRIDETFSVLKVENYSGIDIEAEFVFLARTDEERSLVCPTRLAPASALQREDGFKGFRIQGVLDFSLIGVLARITAILAEKRIGVFVVSTYNTDYVLVKEENYEHALASLACAGYTVI